MTARDRAALRAAERVLLDEVDRLRGRDPHVAAVVGDAADRLRGAAVLLDLHATAGPVAAQRAASRALRDLGAVHDWRHDPPADAVPVDETTG